MIHSRQNLVAQLSFNGPEQTKVQGRCCVTAVMVQWLAGCGWLLGVGLAVGVQYSLSWAALLQPKTLRPATMWAENVALVFGGFSYWSHHWLVGSPLQTRERLDAKRIRGFPARVGGMGLTRPRPPRGKLETRL